MKEEIDRPKSLQKLIEKLPEHLMFIGVALLLIDEFVGSIFGIQLLVSETYDVRMTLAISVVAFFVFSITKRLDKIQASFLSDRQFLGVIEVLPPHQYLDFCELVLNCKTVRLLSLSGTKAGVLGDSAVREALLDKTRKSSVTILLANPHSDAIVYRYEHDEPDTYEAGLEGIERRIIALFGIHSSLPISVRANKLDIRIFNSYPTLSIIQADDDLYSASYGYKLRGGDCPKIHAKVGGDYARFLLHHFSKTYRDAVPLEQWMSKYHPELLTGESDE